MGLEERIKILKSTWKKHLSAHSTGSEMRVKGTIMIRAEWPDNVDIEQVKMDVCLALSGAMTVKSVEVEDG